MRLHDGEYIYLAWDGPIEAYYIKGYVSLEYATQLLNREAGYTPSSIVHKYAKWIPCNNHEYFNKFLTVYDTQRRGAFHVTECR